MGVKFVAPVNKTEKYAQVTPDGVFLIRVGDKWLKLEDFLQLLDWVEARYRRLKWAEQVVGWLLCVVLCLGGALLCVWGGRWLFWGRW